VEILAKLLKFVLVQVKQTRTKAPTPQNTHDADQLPIMHLIDSPSQWSRVLFAVCYLLSSSQELMK
jgi:hypothetical protein